MKLKIKVAFTDKYNAKHYTKDDVIEFDDARAKELLADERNLVTVVKEVEKKSTKSKEKK